MAKRKLAAFSADEANDVFTPSVKTVQGGSLEEGEASKKPSTKQGKRTQQPVKKPAAASSKPAARAKAKPAAPAKKKSAVAPPEPKAVTPQAPQKPAKAVQGNDLAINEAIGASASGTNLVRGSAQDASEVIQLVGFCLGDEEFGVNINEVHEINRTMEITPVPRTPDFIEGVINLRGKVIPVINMRKRFSLPFAEKTNQTRIVIVEMEGKIVGMLVDSVTEVLRIASSTIEPPPDILSGIDNENIQGVAKLENRLLILLDLAKVLSNVDS